MAGGNVLPPDPVAGSERSIVVVGSAVVGSVVVAAVVVGAAVVVVGAVVVAATVVGVKAGTSRPGQLNVTVPLSPAVVMPARKSRYH